MTKWSNRSSAMAERIRNFDWARTSLGSSETWSDRLKLMVEQALANPLAASLVCGTGRVLIYISDPSSAVWVRRPRPLSRADAARFAE